MSDVDEALKQIQLQREQWALEDERHRRSKKAKTDKLAVDAANTAKRVVGVAAAQVFESKKRIGRPLKMLGKGALIASVVPILLFVYHLSDPYAWKNSSPTPVANFAQPRISSVSPDKRAQDYQLAVNSVERHYPVLNEDSPQFRPDLADKVIARMGVMIASGTAKDIAVRMAADEVMANVEARQGSAPAASVTQAKVYKCEAGGRLIYSDSPCNRQ